MIEVPLGFALAPLVYIGISIAIFTACVAGGIFLGIVKEHSDFFDFASFLFFCLLIAVFWWITIPIMGFGLVGYVFMRFCFSLKRRFSNGN